MEVQHNLSHERKDETFQVSLQKLIDKIKKRGDLPHVSMEKQLELVDSLTQFDLGRFLIERGGLNGLWTYYATTHPDKGRVTGTNNRGEPFSQTEAFLLDSSPTALAMQQKFVIFKAEIQKRVFDGCRLASIPSGLMADLLDLDYSRTEDFMLYGVDLDLDSIEGASELARTRGLFEHCTFSCEDAWNLEMEEQFDVISSNGLNIYEPNDGRVIQLYRQFHKFLKSGGHLIISFLTPPPIPGMQTEWDLKKIKPQDALLQKIIFTDILEGKWQVFRSEQNVKDQLLAAGFEKIEIIYDDAHIFPTVVARKGDEGRR